MALKLHGARLLPVMLPKSHLVKGEYYIGVCRNASVARWDGEKFWHWRRKWGYDFVESIHHPDDEELYDCFVPVYHCDGHEVKPVITTQFDDYPKQEEGDR